MRFTEQGTAMTKYKNVFYFTNINSIGGVETFYWYLAQKYHDRDIVIIYKTGDENQIQRLRKFVRVLQFTGQDIYCEKAFFNYTIDIIDHVHADEYYQLIHGDYTKFNITPYIPPKIDHFLGVSQLVCDTWEQVTGQHAEVAYNPIVIRKPRKVLKLISATRLTREKGKDRMIQFADMLDKAQIPFVWTVFTDDPQVIPNPSVIFRKPKLDIIDYIADADYLVQLSDTEGYGFSVVEALTVGTPVIVTDCPVFKELGLVHGKNSFILPFDMSDVPITDIYKGLPKFDYKPIEDRWGEILAKGENSYEKDLKTIVEIVVTKEYIDMQLNRKCFAGDVIKVSKVRAEYIISAGYAKWKGKQDGTL